MSRKQREDLDWLAFRYVAAELSPADSREFEQRLEYDQKAREAVGRVVEVTCAVRSLEWDVVRPHPTTGRRHHWYRQRGVRWIAGLALGLTLAVFIRGLPDGRRSLRRDDTLAVSPTGELALAWSTARAELDSVSPASDWNNVPAGTSSDRRGEMIMHAGPATDQDSIVDAPDWLILAVVAMESKAEPQNLRTKDREGT